MLPPSEPAHPSTTSPAPFCPPCNQSFPRPPTPLTPQPPSPPQLEAIINDKVKEEAPLFGFEQEYTMLAKGGHIYGEAG